MSVTINQQTVIRVPLQSALVTGGTVIVNYPAGVAGDMFSATDEHTVYAEALQASFTMPNAFSIALGNTQAVLTYSGATTIPANSVLMIGLVAANTPSVASIPGLSKMIRNDGWQILSDRPNNLDLAAGHTVAQIAVGSILSVTGRFRHRAMFAADHIALVYGNWSSDNSQNETPGRTPLHVAAALQKNGSGGVTDETGARVPVTMGGGNPVGSIFPDGLLISDPVGFNVDCNEVFFTRTAAIVNGPSCLFPGAGAPMGGTSISGLNNGEGVVAENSVMVGNTVQGGGATGLLAPVAVLGRSSVRHRTVGLIGDSICTGLWDFASYYNAGGWPERLMSNQTQVVMNAMNGFGNTNISNFSYVKCARSGQTIANFADITKSYKEMRLLEFASTVVCQYGTNDIVANSASLATMQANLLTVAGLFNARGVHFIACTITPRTTSTDSWTTVGNQTVLAQESVRVAYNTWLRDGSPTGFVAQASSADVFDSAAGIEVNAAGVRALNGGFWPGRISIGLHTGTASSANALIVNDTATVFPTDGYRGYNIQMTSGAASGLIVPITTVLVSAIRLGVGFSIAPTAGDTYSIGQWATLDGIHPESVGHWMIANSLNNPANLAKII